MPIIGGTDPGIDIGIDIGIGIGIDIDVGIGIDTPLIMYGFMGWLESDIDCAAAASVRARLGRDADASFVSAVRTFGGRPRGRGAGTGARGDASDEAPS